MIPKKTDVRSQKTHVERDVREKTKVMTNGHSRTRMGVKCRYFQKSDVTVEMKLASVGSVDSVGMCIWESCWESWVIVSCM